MQMLSQETLDVPDCLPPPITIRITSHIPKEICQVKVQTDFNRPPAFLLITATYLLLPTVGQDSSPLRHPALHYIWR